MQGEWLDVRHKGGAQGDEALTGAHFRHPSAGSDWSWKRANDLSGVAAANHARLVRETD